MWPFGRKRDNAKGEREEQAMSEEQKGVQQGQEGQSGGQQEPPKTVEVPVDFFANLGETLQNINQKLDFVAKSAEPAPPPPPPPPEIKDVSDADYYEAIADANRSGDYTKVREMDAIRRNATEERAVRRIEERVGPQLTEGARAISQLSSSVLRSEMPFYDDLKDEIEAELGKATPEQRANPDLMRAAYHYVVGRNTDKIIDLEMQRRLRQGEVVIPGTPGTGAGDRQQGAAEGQGAAGEAAPPYTEVLSKDSVDALKAVGKTGDDYARSLGYKNWSDYYNTMHKPFYEGEGGAT